MSDSEKRKNLVLGGGLIGSHLAQFLEEKGEEVVVLSRSQGYDLKHSEKYIDQFAWADRVWFVAWEIGVWKKENADAYEIEILENNLHLCESVFDSLKKTKRPFLFVSSHASSVTNTLGVTKRVGELWTKLLNGHVARLWNVYGWEPIGERSHLIPDFVWKGLEGNISLMSNGEEERQFLYVRDCVEALFHQFEIGQKYADISSGEWVPIKEVATMVGKKLGATVHFGEKPGNPGLQSPEFVLPSWKPRFSLDEGIEQVIIDAKKIWNQKKD